MMQVGFSEAMKRLSSTARELAALRAWMQGPGGIHRHPTEPAALFVVSDNQALPSLLRKGGSMKDGQREELQEIGRLAELIGWILFPVWQRRSTPIMKACDRLSRVENTEGRLVQVAERAGTGATGGTGFITAAQASRDPAIALPFSVRRTHWGVNGDW